MGGWSARMVQPTSDQFCNCSSDGKWRHTYSRNRLPPQPHYSCDQTTENWRRGEISILRSTCVSPHQYCPCSYIALQSDSPQATDQSQSLFWTCGVHPKAEAILLSGGVFRQVQYVFLSNVSALKHSRRIAISKVIVSAPISRKRTQERKTLSQLFPPGAERSAWT